MEIIHTEEEKAQFKVTRCIDGIVNPFSRDIAREWYGYSGTDSECRKLADFIERRLRKLIRDLFEENRIALPPGLPDD